MAQDSQQGAFSRRTVFWILLVGGTAFAGALFLTLFKDEFTPSGRAGANSYSWSAIGHRAFLDVLTELGVPAESSRHDSAHKVRDRGGVLVVAEPRTSDETAEALTRLLGADTVLLVLPKWSGTADPKRIEWLKSSKPADEGTARQLLEKVDPTAKLIRSETEPNWNSVNFAELRPDIGKPQLVSFASQLTPVVWSKDGILVGEKRIDGRRLWLLADPDLIANHNLDRGDNARLAVRMIEALREGHGPVVFDETLHGFEVAPNIWKNLFQPPLLVLTLQAAAALAVLLLAINSRFGAPQTPAPALKAGKRGLIDNTANLLRFGGHDRALLSRYLQLVIHETARRLHAPPGTGEGALTEWLVRIGHSRGLSAAIAETPRKAAHLANDPQADGTKLVRMARDLYQWKSEILHEHGTRSGR